jgi:NADPH2:quinone reductase
VGYQASGTIVEVGPDAGLLRAGDRVVAMMNHGSHAEFVVAEADAVFQVPDELDLATAAAVPIEFGTAAEALSRGRLIPGESVLVTAGAGGVGLAAVQLARLAGARTVIATASSASRAERIKQFGADEVIDYTQEDLNSRVCDITGGEGVDLVVEQVGGSMLEASVRSLTYGGRISWVGQAGREPQSTQLWPIVPNNGDLLGVHFGQARLRDPMRIQHMVHTYLQMLADGLLQVKIDSTYALADAPAAHQRAESRAAFGRILITP